MADDGKLEFHSRWWCTVLRCESESESRRERETETERRRERWWNWIQAHWPLRRELIYANRKLWDFRPSNSNICLSDFLLKMVFPLLILTNFLAQNRLQCTVSDNQFLCVYIMCIFESETDVCWSNKLNSGGFLWHEDHHHDHTVLFPSVMRCKRMQLIELVLAMRYIGR